MKKIIYLISMLFYFMLNNVSHALEPEVLENQKSVPNKSEIILGALNTIVMTASLPNSMNVSISQACANIDNADFNRLNSRVSFCQKFDMTLYVDDNEAYVTGYVYRDEDDTTNTLDWPVKFKFFTTYSNPTGPLIQIAPRLECGTDDGVLLCNQTGGTPTVVLTPGLSNEVIIQTKMNMNSKSESSFGAMNIGANYNIVGQSIDLNSPYYTGSTTPEIRCDVNLARANSSGCIFIGAAAVLKKINVNDPDVDESAWHIRDAFNAGLPGKFIASSDGVTVAGGAVPLTRLKDIAARRANRSESISKCKQNFGAVSLTCGPETGDPEDTPVDCDCDEYPFAATLQGAKNNLGIDVSVRRIDPSDNRRAGAYLGAFYFKQRVLDGENFYLEVE